MVETNELQSYMQEYLDGLHMNEQLRKAMKYSLISDGKMIRPLVFFLFLNDNDIDGRNYINVACAIEMIHTYSLIHDDLPAMDDDDYRRGKLANHKVFGEAIAILAGDALLTQSFGCILDCDLTAIKKNQIIAEMVNCAGANSGMINGQVLDVMAVDDVDEQYLSEVHVQKTSKLFQLALISAAIISDKIEQKDQLVDFCDKIGLVYQVQDDYLDLYGQDIGKITGSDQMNDKKTYVDFYTQDELQKYINKLLKEALEIGQQLGFSDQLLELFHKFGKRVK